MYAVEHYDVLRAVPRRRRLHATKGSKTMKGVTIAGIVLIVLAVAGFTVGRVSYTTKEKAIDLGPIEVTTEEKHDVAIPEIAAIIAVAAGLVLVVVGMRKA